MNKTCPENLCDGSGYVPEFDNVEEGLPMVMSDEKPCLCRLNVEQEYDNQDCGGGF